MVADVSGPPAERMVTSTVWPISMEARFVVRVQAGAGISATVAEHSAEREIFFTFAVMVSPSGAHSTWLVQPLSFLVKAWEPVIDGSSDIAPPVEATKTLHRVEVAFSLVAMMEQLGDIPLATTALAQLRPALVVTLVACSVDWQVSGSLVSMPDGPVKSAFPQPPNRSRTKKNARYLFVFMSSPHKTGDRLERLLALTLFFYNGITGS